MIPSTAKWRGRREARCSSGACREIGSQALARPRHEDLARSISRNKCPTNENLARYAGATFKAGVLGWRICSGCRRCTRSITSLRLLHMAMRRRPRLHSLCPLHASRSLAVPRAVTPAPIRSTAPPRLPPTQSPRIRPSSSCPDVTRIETRSFHFLQRRPRPKRIVYHSTNLQPLVLPLVKYQLPRPRTAPMATVRQVQFSGDIQKPARQSHPRQHQVSRRRWPRLLCPLRSRV